MQDQTNLKLPKCHLPIALFGFPVLFLFLVLVFPFGCCACCCELGVLEVILWSTSCSDLFPRASERSFFPLCVLDPVLWWPFEAPLDDCLHVLTSSALLFPVFCESACCWVWWFCLDPPLVLLSESAALVSCALCVSLFAVFILVTCSWITCSWCLWFCCFLHFFVLDPAPVVGLVSRTTSLGLATDAVPGWMDSEPVAGLRSGDRTRMSLERLGVEWSLWMSLAAVVVSSQPFTISRSLLKFLSERGARSKSICCKSEDPLRWDSRWFPSSVAAFFGKSLTSRLRSYMLKEARMESFMVFLISSRRLVRKLLTRSSSSWGHSNSLFASPSEVESSTGSGGDAERGSLLASSTLPWRALSFSFSWLLRNQ